MVVGSWEWLGVGLMNGSKGDDEEHGCIWIGSGW